MRNILSVDVEEVFHATEVQLTTDTSLWAWYPPRVETQTRRVLEMLAHRGVKATFFVLGWVAQRYPGLIREIASQGHEVGCHSYAHRLVYEMTPEEFRADLARACRAIQDACGISPRAYRAPSYSITSRALWALEILVEFGFTHDSSIYPINHDRYGIPGFTRRAHFVSTPAGPILETPIATVRLSDSSVAPIGGGGYLRLLPYAYTAAGIRRLNYRENMAACIYFHPWELDTEQPRLARGLAGLRTYAGLAKMANKVDRLLTDFTFAALGEVHPVQAAQPRAAAGG